MRTHRLRLIALATAALVATACGSSSSNNNDDGTPPEPTSNTAVITSTDFAAIGLLSLLDLTTFEITNNVAEVSTDPVPRVFDGIIYVINRFFADNVQVIDPNEGFATTDQFTTENGSNPQDAVVIGDLAYVTRFEGEFSDVQVLNLTDGSTVATIDLLPFADTATDPSVLPRPGAIAQVGDLLYVALGQFDATFSIFGAGSVAVIDPNTFEVVDAIQIGQQDPSAFWVDGTDLYVSSAGIFFTQKCDEPGANPKSSTLSHDHVSPVATSMSPAPADNSSLDSLSRNECPVAYATQRPSSENSGPVAKGTEWRASSSTAFTWSVSSPRTRP